MSDLEDQEHDRGVLESGKGITTILSDECPCPNPAMCDFTEGRRCRTCKRKRSISTDTDKVQLIYLRLRGGMPLSRETLAACQWEILGYLSAKYGGMRF